MRVLDVSDGFTATTAPTTGDLTASGLLVYVSDAAYVVANGTATAGDAYENSADGQIHYYDGAAWVAVVTPASASVFTNKDFDGGTASNTKRITVPKDTLANLTALTRKAGTVAYATDQAKLYYDDGTVLLPVGSGSGGDVNYVTNSDLESDTTGWSTYADAASATPEDGTGGSANITRIRYTTLPLRGNGSLRITKDAVNRIGEGVSYPFTIAAADSANVLEVAFTYAPSDAFSPSDVTVWIYDVTNAVLIQPAPYTLSGGPGPSPSYARRSHRFRGQFQTASNSTSYRLMFHVATTNASGWFLDLDDVRVGPPKLVSGAAVTDPIDWTPVASWTANTTPTGQYWRVGHKMHGWVKLALAGAPTSASLTFTLPGGRSIDTTRLPAGVASTVPAYFGDAELRDTGTTVYKGKVAYSSTTTLSVVVLNRPTTYVEVNTAVTQAVPFTFGNTDEVYIEFSVPITGWAANCEMSNDSETRVIAARYTNTLTSAVPNTATVFDFATKSFDTHNAVTTGASWKFTAPVSGYYRVSAAVAATGALVNSFVLAIRKNGTDYKNITSPQEVAASYTTTFQITDVVQLNAGDYVDVTHHETVNSASYSNTYSQVIDVTRQAGPQAIAASETVAARYTAASSAAVPNSATVFDFSTKDYDTHSSVTTGASWKFTAPISGLYEVRAALLFNSSVISNYRSAIRKNGTDYSYAEVPQPVAANFNFSSHIATRVRLLAGEYVDVTHYESVNGASYVATSGGQSCEVIRVGSY